MFEKMRLFLKESRQELKRVNWPTRQETVRLTFIVIGMSLAVAVFLGLADFGLSTIIRRVVLPS